MSVLYKFNPSLGLMTKRWMINGERFAKSISRYIVDKPACIPDGAVRSGVYVIREHKREPIQYEYYKDKDAWIEIGEISNSDRLQKWILFPNPPTLFDPNLLESMERCYTFLTEEGKAIFWGAKNHKTQRETKLLYYKASKLP